MSNNEKKMTILVGDGDELLSFYAGYKHPDRIAGIFCGEGFNLPAGLLRLGAVSSVPAYLDTNPCVTRVMCGVSRLAEDDAKRIQVACKTRAVKFCTVLPVVNSLEGKFVQMHLGPQMLLTPVSEPLTHAYNRIVKRLFDFLLVLVFMLVFFPFVYIFKAIVLKRKKRGATFSTCLCCGPEERPFHRVSFRKEPHSLAQLFNVLIGQMSLVGPEPYELTGTDGVAQLPKHLVRHGVKPGMTGWAQFRNVKDEERLAADIWYVEHWSLWLDIKILLHTLVLH